MARVRTFRELRVFQAAFERAMEIFWLSGSLPSDERYGLTSQIRRSSRSVAANIAEAWRKRRYPAAFVSKLSDAEAEAAETRCHLDFARACGYLAAEQHAALDAQYERLTGQLVRMIGSAETWSVGLIGPPARRGRGNTVRRSRPESRRPPDPPSPRSPAQGAGNRSADGQSTHDNLPHVDGHARRPEDS